MLNSLNDPTRCRNHSRATKIGARTWKRNELCSKGVPCLSRRRKRIRPASESSISSLRRAKLTRAALTTERSSAIESSSRTKPWSSSVCCGRSRATGAATDSETAARAAGTHEQSSKLDRTTPIQLGRAQSYCLSFDAVAASTPRRVQLVTTDADDRIVVWGRLALDEPLRQRRTRSARAADSAQPMDDV